ncbi:multicopper oxidase family protein [Streptomyces sp. NPDC002132]|uniref:multicopper oxidase family protein n=1 Tax=unclassified Streptomyces TaxID=2593676 RepID=UPI00331A4B0D
MNTVDRRSVLRAGLGAAAAGALAACTRPSSAPALVSPSGAAVAAAERERAGTGPTRAVTLVAAPARVELGAGLTAETWAFDGRTPGREIRVSAGDRLAATLANRLPDGAATSVHWHGIALRNDMDGIPQVTQRPVAAGSDFTYRFGAGVPGTYFFHPHVGVQLDRGLYAPLIVEDPKEPLAYDQEWVLVLDDWVDGVAGTPDDVYAELRRGMSGMHMGSPDAGDGTRPPSSGAGMPTRLMPRSRSPLLGGRAGDVEYPHHLINGRVPADPEILRTKPGRRVRLRVINAGGDTAYHVALGGHELTVTHTDGFPVRHQRADALLVGMGERYDALVTLGDGVFPLVALAEGKDATGMAAVRTGSGGLPRASTRPRELDGRIVFASRLCAADAVRLPPRKPDRVHRVELTGGMMAYDWSVAGRRFDIDDPTAHPLTVEEGRRVQLDFVNTTAMWHPMHLHGHTFQLGVSGPRKDTAVVLPRTTVSVAFDADNPGRWMLHCHNAYHAEAGMMALLAYLG